MLRKLLGWVVAGSAGAYLGYSLTKEHMEKQYDDVVEDIYKECYRNARETLGDQLLENQRREKEEAEKKEDVKREGEGAVYRRIVHDNYKAPEKTEIKTYADSEEMKRKIILNSEAEMLKSHILDVSGHGEIIPIMEGKLDENGAYSLKQKEELVLGADGEVLQRPAKPDEDVEIAEGDICEDIEDILYEVVDKDRFRNEKGHYQKVDLFYFDGDDVITDQTDEMIMPEEFEDYFGPIDIKTILRPSLVQEAGDIYIRHNPSETDYRIIRVNGFYKDIQFETDRERERRRAKRKFGDIEDL